MPGQEGAVTKGYAGRAVYKRAPPQWAPPETRQNPSSHKQKRAWQRKAVAEGEALKAIRLSSLRRKWQAKAEQRRHQWLGGSAAARGDCLIAVPDAGRPAPVQSSTAWDTPTTGQAHSRYQPHKHNTQQTKPGRRRGRQCPVGAHLTPGLQRALAPVLQGAPLLWGCPNIYTQGKKEVQWGGGLGVAGARCKRGRHATTAAAVGISAGTSGRALCLAAPMSWRLPAGRHIAPLTAVRRPGQGAEQPATSPRARPLAYGLSDPGAWPPASGLCPRALRMRPSKP